MMIRPEFDVNKALCAIEGLRYEELVEMIEVISDPGTEEEVGEYYGELLELTLPGAEVAELILWPQEWFRDRSGREYDLSSEEIANYLLAWTEVRVLGAENIELPKIPEAKAATR